MLIEDILIRSMLVFLLEAAALVAMASSQETAVCEAQKATFHATTGADCVSPEFVRTVSGWCTQLDCSLQCERTRDCQAFRLLTEACQCKLFLFNACSHRVQSVPNCTNQVSVYVRSLPGVPPGRLCPPGFQHTRYGTSYKLYTGSTVVWSVANQSCDSEPGLSKFADAIDLDEANYLGTLKKLTSGTLHSYFIGGYQLPSAGNNKYIGWIWLVCNVSFASQVWHANEPTGGQANGETCANLYAPFDYGIDDYYCTVSGRYICECQSVF